MKDYYADEGEVASNAQGKTEESPMAVEDREGNSPTAVIPKTAFGGKKYSVGDIIEMRVIADNEDSVEAQCVHEGEDTETEPEGEQKMEMAEAPEYE